MLRFLQKYPHLLEILYEAFEKALRPFRRWLRPGAALEPAVTWLEKIGKEAVFDCQMCGQCNLHSTGMTCSMTCPKNLRNGPCGGVQENGHCEVLPEMVCIWVEAYQRSLEMPTFGQDLLQIQPPVNRQLQGTSSWINTLHGIDDQMPDGWMRTNDIPINVGPAAETDKAIWNLNSKEADA